MANHLELIPVTLKEANTFVQAHHRHSKPTVGHKFSIGTTSDGELVGVAIAGRPVARNLDNGFTLEVLRLATDGTANVCSMLYGAVARAGRAMGYKRIITYTLTTECGASLRASGFKQIATIKAKQWNTPSRPRQTRVIHDRVRWER